MKEGLLGFNVFHRIERAVRRRPPSIVDTEPDYTRRWPTVTTLVEQRSGSRFSYESDQYDEEERDAREEHHPAKPVTVKALRAVANSLGWLNVKLESLRDYLDHKILLSEARVQKRASRFSDERGSEQPGHSTHPYDTGIHNTIAEEEEDISRRSSRLPSPLSDQDPPGSGFGALEVRSAAINTPTRQIWKKIRFCHHTGREPLFQSHTTASTDNKSIWPTVQANSPTIKHDSEPWVHTQNSAEPKTMAARLLWNPFSFNDRRAKHERTASYSSGSPKIQLDENDLTLTPEPRSNWKSTRDRRGSAYPGKEISAQPSKVRLFSPQKVPSHHSSGQPDSTAPFVMQRRPSSTNPTGDTVLNSSKSCTPTSGDMSIISPKAGAFRYLLGLVRDSPPSRAISPLDLAENDRPNSNACPPLRGSRRNTDTTASSAGRIARAAGAQSHEAKPVVDEVSHDQRKGSWAAMAVKFRNSREPTHPEPANQLSRSRITSSPRDGKTSSRRESTRGDEVRRWKE